MPGSSPSQLERLVQDAEEGTRNYEWADAAELYEKAITTLAPDAPPLDKGHLIESLARSRYKSSFQENNRDGFCKKMEQAREAYEKALKLYEREKQDSFADRARARTIFTNYWLSETNNDRRELLEKAIPLADRAAKGLEALGDRRALAEAHLDLLTYSYEECCATTEGKVVKEQFQLVAPVAAKLVGEFEGLGIDEVLAECLYRAVYVHVWYLDLVEPSNPAILKKLWEYGSQFAIVSERTPTPYTLSLAKLATAERTFNLDERMVDSLSHFSEAIDAARATRDSYYIGFLLAQSSERAYWAGCAEEGERRKEVFTTGMEWGRKAIGYWEICKHGELLDASYTNWAANHVWNAFFAETEPEKKKEHYQLAIDIARKGRLLNGPGVPWIGTSDVLSKALVFRASIENDPEKKRQLLLEALPIREEVVKTQETLGPGTWNLGVYYNYLALNRAELSRVASDTNARVDQLQAAVSAMQQCVALCENSAALQPVYRNSLGHYYEWYGDILLELYQLTREKDTGIRAVKAYEQAVSNLSKFELTGPTALLRWKIARVTDEIGEIKRASQLFKEASRDFELAAEKIRPLASEYAELSSYMKAWSHIEEARLNHTLEIYQHAAEEYSNAANILRQTKNRAHLFSHYTACSLLEKGEALSREEKHEASAEAFSEALNLFREATSALEMKLGQKISDTNRPELKEWFEITTGRESYSRARLELEEARVLDKRGDGQASRAKYHSAYEGFKQLASETEREQTRRELETLMLFCEAWAKMKEAEAEASPELYAEASRCFTAARESTTLTRFRLLAMANASICNALESGTRFRHTRDIKLYGEIKKQLETAADQYEQAGFKNAAEWTRATQAMFDSLAYMASAEVELEPKKKTEFYHLAERHLELASKTYREAGFQTKSDEASRHLRRARQEKEILLTPVELLSESPAVAGAVVAPVSLIRDHAAGVEKYEAAHVVGNLSLHQKELNVGSNVTIELEMANVGKTAATLIKLENLAPEGLQLDRQNIPHRIEDNYIDMRGKKLEYMKTHEVKVPMKVLAKGTFQIQPRVLFVDEKGTYQSYEFEPVALTVRELGIAGWLKGPGK